MDPATAPARIHDCPTAWQQGASADCSGKMIREQRFDGLFALGFCAALLIAAARGNDFVQRVYQNDGNTMSPFAVACSSTAWTSVLASREARRRAFVQALPSNAYAVCVSTYGTADTTSCSATTNTVLLTTGTPVAAHDFYVESALTCRAFTGSSGERVAGYEAYDSND